VQARLDRYEETPIDDLLDGMAPMEFLLRFTLSHPDLHTMIVGSSQLAHVQANAAAASKGPLPAEQYQAARERFS
jgi:aryl-alcohol dehydrogenase-like predicted oxidoreductase